MDIHKLAEKLAHKRAQLIDAQLAVFLAELGIDTSVWEPGTMKQQLKNLGYEVVYEIKPEEDKDMYTFKLCKIVSQTTFSVPNPTLTIT